LQSAIFCCLVEHLLEKHFDTIFPQMRDLILRDIWYDSWAFGASWVHGLRDSPHNARRFARLERWCRERRERRLTAKRRQREMWHASQSWGERRPSVFSREAATDRSPRRQPGVRATRERQPRRGDRT
jgi:hypothetical protein